MTSCNGERYVREQLDSFARQTRLPDEVVVCDDRSDDDTAKVLADFAASASFPLTIRRNPERLGFIKNFEQAVALCTGDVIFLSDQDDSWLPEKLARHEAAYARRADLGAVYSDAEVVDGELRPLHRRLWEMLNLGPKQQRMINSQRGLDLFLRRGYCYGFLLSFRAEFREFLIPFPLNCPHDEWIMLILSAFTPIEATPESMVLYRQHRNQAIGVGLIPKVADAPSGPPPDPGHELRVGVKRMDDFEGRVAQFESRLLRDDCRRLIRKRRSYLERRLSIPSKGTVSKLLIIARDLVSGDYLRFGTYPKKDLLADLGR